MRALLFFAFLLACVVYALWKGGKPERLAAVAMLLAAILTPLLYSPAGDRFGDVEYRVLAVDVALLLVCISLALTTDRYWLIWTAALQLVAVLAHIAKIADPEMMRNGYAFLVAIWSYPMLATLALGTWSQHKFRKQASVSSRSS
jgi:hypothetical protein